MENDLELILGFSQEAREYLDEVEPALIELSQGSGDTGEPDMELINGVFRLFHSMKGSAGFLHLNTVAGLTHEAETLLDRIRKGKASLSHAVTELLCQTLDLFREMLDSIEAKGDDSGFEVVAQEMGGRLAAACEGSAPHSAPVPAEKKANPAPKPATKPAPAPAVVMPLVDLADVTDPAAQAQVIAISEEMRKGFFQEGGEQLDAAEQSLLGLENPETNKTEALNEAFRNIHSFKGNCGFMGFVDLEKLSHRMETALDGMREQKVSVETGNVGVLLSLIDVLRDGVNAINAGSNGAVVSLDVYLELLGEMLPAPEAGAETEVAAEDSENRQQMEDAAAIQRSAERTQKAMRQDIRVDLQKLDSLINLVGELVIAEAMVTRNPVVADVEDEYYLRATHQLRRICDELQDIAMSVRMIPLSGVFRKMIRLVHDLSNKAHKKLRLNIVGEDTEVDKTVIEQIGDPLVHIVRNSCDHGVEPPEERLKAGKPEVGTVTIEGRHEGGEVWIIIKDDGRGLNRDKILARGIERGLVQGDGRDLSDERIFRLIFEPGFSTADKITDISGRGVGMDVVKRNIDKLNGRVDVKSTPGHGTTIILRIPLTLAIIDGMLVRVGNTKYTIPVLSIRESLRPEHKRITITPDRREILRLREELIPVVRLHDVFNRKGDSTNLEEGILVIVEDAGVSVALFIDEIVGQQQTVIKGLSNYIGKARGCSGCTILGDGSVSLILDINSLVALADEKEAGNFANTDDYRTQPVLTAPAAVGEA